MARHLRDLKRVGSKELEESDEGGEGDVAELKLYTAAAGKPDWDWVVEEALPADVQEAEVDKIKHQGRGGSESARGKQITGTAVILPVLWQPSNLLFN